MKFAVIQIRGTMGMDKKRKDTLKFLKLVKKNSCAVVEGDRVHLGMLVLLKDYVTWGELDEATLKELIIKRGRIVGNKQLTEQYLKDQSKMGYDEFAKSFFNSKIKMKEVPGLKPFFRLKPPQGGFDRAGIKTPFSLGGALGYRKDNINQLIRRML